MIIEDYRLQAPQFISELLTCLIFQVVCINRDTTNLYIIPHGPFREMRMELTPLDDSCYNKDRALLSELLCAFEMGEEGCLWWATPPGSNHSAQLVLLSFIVLKTLSNSPAGFCPRSTDSC